jgi:hypothetical protein
MTSLVVNQQMPAISDGVNSIIRFISAKRRGEKMIRINSQGKVAGSIRRMYGESSFKDVCGYDSTSVHQKKKNG